MTVVVAVKVFDGIVIAADSATTLRLPDGSSQVYNNANKIFHLHRKQPVAAATWGLGGLGPASTSSLAKDLRRRFMGADPEHRDWELDGAYTIRGVADRLLQMMYDELYSPLVSSGQAPQETLGFLVAGYPPDGGNHEAEMWSVQMEDPAVRPVPQLEAGTDQMGWVAFAIHEAARRLFNGYDPSLPDQLANVLDPALMASVWPILQSLHRQPVPAGMPFADAINFAQFLTDTTIGYTHYLLGPDVVGGPVEVAGISRYEGFKWVHRKHYYRPELNPESPDHVV